jgi:hypothetical protein
VLSDSNEYLHAAESPRGSGYDELKAMTDIYTPRIANLEALKAKLAAACGTSRTVTLTPDEQLILGGLVHDELRSVKRDQELVATARQLFGEEPLGAA